MELFGFVIPLWAFFIGIVIILFVAWKFIKFAIKILVILVAFFIILFGLDFFGVFDIIKNIFLGII